MGGQPAADRKRIIVMKAIVAGVVMTITLTGCAQLGFGTEDKDHSSSATPTYIDASQDKKEEPGFFQRLFGKSTQEKKPAPESVRAVKVNDNPHALTLADYVAKMSQQMIKSAKYVNPRTPIGVASFVSLENLRKTSPFGMQLAESFVFEMQQNGLSVIDYKATGFIRITPTGDFVYSRNTRELPKRQPIEYLLVGTYSRTLSGYMVNARLVGARSKVVVASGQQLVPVSIYDSVMNVDPQSNKPAMRDGVILIQSPQ